MSAVPASAGAPRWRARQYHYLSAKSHVHPFLVDLWDEVRRETGGALDTTVYAANEGITGTHLDIVERLAAGDIEFYVLMGGILGAWVPPMEIQGLPFAFADHRQVHDTLDGPLGDYLRGELLARGVYALPGGLLENGFRHLCMVERDIRHVDDLAGVRIRVPEGRMFHEAFRALGAEPVEVNVLKLREALTTRRIDGHENPLAITEALQFQDVTRSISLTGHMWSGFNLIASRKFWDALPDDVRDAIQRAVRKHVARQRAHTDALNRDLETSLGQQGIKLIRPDVASFRQRLADSGFYTRSRTEMGATAWRLLEDAVGPLT